MRMPAIVTSGWPPVTTPWVPATTGRVVARSAVWCSISWTRGVGRLMGTDHRTVREGPSTGYHGGSRQQIPGGRAMYDLVLKGGRVVDPASGLDGVLDVAVENGKIARVAADIVPTEAARVIEVGGKIVTPGLIDLHAHVFEGVNRTGVNPDLAGVYSGVTTIVDAGSAGSATFGGWRHILPHCHTEIVPFLHICQTGLATSPDIIAESSVSLTDTVRVATEHRGVIHGIKARMVSPALEIMGMEMPRLARRAAKEAGIRLMVHIGDTEKRYDPKVIHPLLSLLEPGDILTHYFTPNPGGVLDANGKLVPEIGRASCRE